MSFSNDFFNKLREAANKASDTFNPLDKDYQGKLGTQVKSAVEPVTNLVKSQLGANNPTIRKVNKATTPAIKFATSESYRNEVSSKLANVHSDNPIANFAIDTLLGTQERRKESVDASKISKEHGFSNSFLTTLTDAQKKDLTEEEKNLLDADRKHSEEESVMSVMGVTGNLGGVSKKAASSIIENIAKTDSVKGIIKLSKKIGIDDPETLVKLMEADTVDKVTSIVKSAKPTIQSAVDSASKGLASVSKPVGKVDVPTNPYGDELRNLIETKKLYDAGEMGAKEANGFMTRWNNAVKSGAIDAEVVSKNAPKLSEPQKEITSVVDDAFKGVKEKFPEIAKLVDENNVPKKTASNTTLNLRNAGNVLTDHFGGFGGELSTRLERGVNINDRLQETTRPILDEIGKITEKIAKTSIGKKTLNEKVINALEARDNPGFRIEDFLDNKVEIKTFELAKEFFDSYKKILQEKGIPVKSGYFTHIGDVDNLIQGVSRDSKLPKDVASGFVKERLKDGSENISKDLLEVMNRYDSSMRKYLSYDDALKYYDTNIDKIPEVYLNREDSRVGQDYLHQLMKDVINPDASTGVYRATTKALKTTYSSQLWNSPKATAQNYMQRFFADAYVGEGKKMASKIAPETKDYIIQELRKNETSILDELEGQGAKNSFTRFLKKIDAFQAVERGNWDSSGLKGFLEEISQSPAYRDLRVKGMPVNDAIIEAFSNDPELLARAFRRGDVLMNTTQIGANKALQPGWFRDKSPVLGIPKPLIKQYKRFSIAMVENFKQMFSPHGVRETMILKRNVPEQVEIVDKIRMGEETLRSIDDIMKGVKNKEIKGVTVNEISQFRKGIESEIKTLQETTKNYEKYTGGKAVRSLAKIWAASSTIQMINDMVVSSVNPDAPEPSVERAVSYGAPMQGGIEAAVGSGIWGANNPIQPGFNKEILGLTSRKDIAKVAPNFIPGVGVVNRMIPGRPVSKLFEALMGVKTKD